MIAIEPRGADLSALTAETRREAGLAASAATSSRSGHYAGTWRGGEAVVLREWAPSGYSERWLVIVRRGLRCGAPQRVVAGSIAAALTALGIAYRIRSVRRPPIPPEPSSRAGRRRVLLRAIHRRGNTWRTLRARAA
ncbi:MAG: hypothetical protein E6J90_14080 [Deltaproteobacteria bacterium]|nr:MAG: hypothetical protein E6J91_29870 [Deltaproteobacteria bacterium]TMQ21579.1 MAG: hypothetical protein E6J90_14080 [Deltaproteobacteria bacterium]